MNTNQWDADIEKGIIKEINKWDKYTGGYCAQPEVKGIVNEKIRHRTVSELLEDYKKGI